jgi:hypothetical protein
MWPSVAGPASISPVTVPPGAPGLWPASQARWHHDRPLAFPGVTVNSHLRRGMGPRLLRATYQGAKLAAAGVGHGGQGPHWQGPRPPPPVPQTRSLWIAGSCRLGQGTVTASQWHARAGSLRLPCELGLVARPTVAHTGGCSLLKRRPTGAFCARSGDPFPGSRHVFLTSWCAYPYSTRRMPLAVAPDYGGATCDF